MNNQTTGWKKESGYIWSLLGTAVGFANILGFGTQCYRNGGGAFLIPFFSGLLILGVPMLFLEGIIGQKFKLPLVSAYGKVLGKPGKFFGWIAILTVMTIGSFYLVLTGWSLSYAWFSFFNQIPENTADFFVQDFLHHTGSIAHLGSLSWPIFFGSLVSVGFGWYVVSQNIQSGIEKWCSLFLPLLAGILVIFAILVVFLPGAATGFSYYLRPDFSKLLNGALWRDAFGHLFFSLSLGIGIVVGYSRHSGQKIDIKRAMIRVAFADFLISFVCGFVIFGCIGFLGFKEHSSIESLIETTSNFDIGYVIFPVIFQSFPKIISSIIGSLFFFCLFIAGITGVFSIVESIAGNVEVERGLSRKQAVSVVCVGMGVLAIVFCMGNGTSLIDALAPMVLGYVLLIGALAQLVVFFYRSQEVIQDPIWKRTAFCQMAFHSLKYFSPCVLILVFFSAFYHEFDSGFHLPEMVRWGWLVGAMIVAYFLSRSQGPSKDLS